MKKKILPVCMLVCLLFTVSVFASDSVINDGHDVCAECIEAAIPLIPDALTLDGTVCPDCGVGILREYCSGLVRGKTADDTEDDGHIRTRCYSDLYCTEPGCEFVLTCASHHVEVCASSDGTHKSCCDRPRADRGRIFAKPHDDDQTSDTAVTADVHIRDPFMAGDVCPKHGLFPCEECYAEYNAVYASEIQCYFRLCDYPQFAGIGELYNHISENIKPDTMIYLGNDVLYAGFESGTPSASSHVIWQKKGPALLIEDGELTEVVFYSCSFHRECDLIVSADVCAEWDN